MSVRDARVYTCKRVLYTISYRVPAFTKLHDRRIPKVRVGVHVGPMEFQPHEYAEKIYVLAVPVRFRILSSVVYHDVRSTAAAARCVQ